MAARTAEAVVGRDKRSADALGVTRGDSLLTDPGAVVTFFAEAVVGLNRRLAEVVTFGDTLLALDPLTVAELRGEGVFLVDAGAAVGVFTEIGDAKLGNGTGTRAGMGVAATGLLVLVFDTGVAVSFIGVDTGVGVVTAGLLAAVGSVSFTTETGVAGTAGGGGGGLFMTGRSGCGGRATADQSEDIRDFVLDTGAGAATCFSVSTGGVFIPTGTGTCVATCFSVSKGGVFIIPTGTGTGVATCFSVSTEGVFITTGTGAGAATSFSISTGSVFIITTGSGAGVATSFAVSTGGAFITIASPCGGIAWRTCCWLSFSTDTSATAVARVTGVVAFTTAGSGSDGDGVSTEVAVSGSSASRYRSGDSCTALNVKCSTSGWSARSAIAGGVAVVDTGCCCCCSDSDDSSRAAKDGFCVVVGTGELPSKAPRFASLSVIPAAGLGGGVRKRSGLMNVFFGSGVATATGTGTATTFLVAVTGCSCV